MTQSKNWAFEWKLRNIFTVPPAALICRVDAKDIQLFFIIFLRAQAEEVLPVLVQVVDQVPVEAVLCDNVDRPWKQTQQIKSCIGVSLQANLIRGS